MAPNQALEEVTGRVISPVEGPGRALREPLGGCVLREKGKVAARFRKLLAPLREKASKAAE